MAGVYASVKDGLIKLLKGKYPRRSVFAEEIKKVAGEDDGGDPEVDFPDEYFFLDIIPAGMETLGSPHADHSFLVDITARVKSQANADYMELAEEIDSMIRPVFRFKDRAVTVHRASAKVVDRLLHYTFSFSFIPDPAQEEDGQLMNELDVAFHT